MARRIVSRLKKPAFVRGMSTKMPSKSDPIGKCEALNKKTGKRCTMNAWERSFITGKLRCATHRDKYGVAFPDYK